MNKLISVVISIFLLLGTIVILQTDIVTADSQTFTVVVIPDTQKVVNSAHPEYFTDLTEWIVDDTTHNIVFVIHVGDLVDKGDGSSAQWTNADTSLSVLFDNNIPFLMVPGNHDYDNECGSYPRQDTYLNSYFPYTRYWANFNSTGSDSYWGGCLDSKSNNMYAFFNASGYEFIVIGYEYCPCDDTVTWVNNTLNTYSNKNAILFTHTHIYVDDTLVDTDDGNDCGNYACAECGTACDCNNGIKTWDEMIKYHDNIALVCCGHHITDSEVYGAQGYVNGSIPVAYQDGNSSPWVHQFLANYQSDGAVGDAVVRLYEFNVSTNIMNVETYEVSPGDTWHTDNQNEMEVTCVLLEGEGEEEPEQSISFQSLNGQSNNTVVQENNRTFKWNIVSDATKYGLRVSNYSDFHAEIFLQLDNISLAEWSATYYSEADGNVTFILPDQYNITFYGYHYNEVRAYST